MSETMTKQDEEQKDRVPYEVSMDPIDFEADCDMKFLSSNEFCKLANEYFRAAFSDFIGTTFDFVQGYPSVSLYFTHADTDGTRAVQRADKKESGSSLLDKTRSRDLMYREGDRFMITDDGIDVIKPILLPKIYNNGKPNWKNIISDIVDRSAANLFNPNAQQQITKISMIDPRAILGILYGKKSGNSYVDYGIQVCGDLSFKNGLMPGATNSNYVLSITRAYDGHLKKTYERFGIANAGSPIIR